MMDLIMITILAGCIGQVVALTIWCQKQIERNE